MLKVSIIMPVYNAEKYLHRAINSILSQTMKEWELILINDGSTDSSASICEEYTDLDERVKVIHKENEGVAIARKIGIENATGEYSIHFDSDDWAEPTMLEELYNKAKIENSDMVIADYFINDKKKQILCKQEPTSLQPSKVLIDIFNNKLFGALWNKLIRTNLYKKYSATFFYGINYCEDVLVCAQIMKHQEVKIAYLDKAFYHYYINENSITHIITRKVYKSRKLYQEKLNEILTEKFYDKAKKISSLNIFTEGFMNKCLSKQEIISEFKNNEYAAFHYVKSPRWLIGYFMIKIKCYSIAHIFIKY